MKQNSLILLLTLSLATNLFGQATRNYSMSRYESNLISSVKSKPWNPTEFVGSPYYDTQFKLGKVYLNDSLIFDNILLRYNVHKELIEVRRGMEAEIENIQSKPGISFDYGDEHFSLMFNPITGLKQYFRKVYDGPVYKVYLKPIKVFKEGQKAVTHLTRDILPSYLTKDTYYYQRDKIFDEVRTNRSGVRNIFPDHKKEIRDYINNRDLRFRDERFERELNEVIQYYESL